MKKIYQAVQAYLADVDTFIFNDWIDALLGTVPLILVPAVSLLSLLWIEATNFWNYCFPIISISIAGAYDTYGRYRPRAARNLKLAVRLAVDLAAIIVACALQTAQSGWRVAPSLLLLICGIALSCEVIRRVKDAIQSSPWYRKGGK